MSEIGLNINVDSYNNEGIKTIKGNNNAEIYKLYILKNKRRLSLVGKNVKLGYVMAGTTKGDIIENLNITNAEQGEITFPITNRISKKDGVYSCQLAIYGADEFLEYTATFGLTVEANIFTKIAGEIENSKDLTYIERILEEAKTVSGDLKTNIPVATNLNSSLESNINNANNINSTLADTTEKSKVAATDAIEKKSQLESSIVKAKAFIDGLDGSQNIPQLRLDVTELQNGLKNNQALNYEGSSIVANGTLEGRTEGMRIGGRTLVNLCEEVVLNKLVSTTGNVAQIIDNGSVKSIIATNIKANTVYTVIRFGNSSRFTIGAFDNFENGSTGDVLLVNDIEGELVINKITTKNKTNLLIYFTNDSKNPDVMLLEGDWTNQKLPLFFTGLKSFGEKEKVESGYKITILSHGKNLFDETKSEEGLLNVNTGELHKVNTSRTSGYIKVEKNKNYIINGDGGEIRSYYGVLYDNYKNYASHKQFSKNTPFTFNQDGYFRFSYASKEDGLAATNIIFEEGTVSTAFEEYKQYKRDILIKEPLRSKDNVCDLLYEDNGQVKINRYIGIRKYQEGDEKNKEVITDKINTVYVLDKLVTEIVENCVDIDLDTYQERTYFNILNSLPGTLDFKVPSNIGSVVQNMAKEVNNIWDVINNLLVPSIVKANGNIAMINLNNNLK